jgi:hypothetical protein
MVAAAGRVSHKRSFFARELLIKSGLGACRHNFERLLRIIMAGTDIREPAARFAFFLLDPAVAPLERFEMTPEEITLLNPNTGTCPIFRTRRDAEITLGIYRRVPVLVREGDPDGNPWGVSFMRMFDMSNDSHLFRTREQLEDDGWTLRGNAFERTGRWMTPLYQGMMASFYDHRAADVIRSETAQKRQNQPRYLTSSDHKDADRLAIPMYWVDRRELPDERLEWLVGFSDVTSPTNERTLVPYGLPSVAVGHKVPLISVNADAATFAGRLWSK